jgi:hypothetical protein
VSAGLLWSDMSLLQHCSLDRRVEMTGVIENRLDRENAIPYRPTKFMKKSKILRDGLWESEAIHKIHITGPALLILFRMTLC